MDKILTILQMLDIMRYRFDHVLRSMRSLLFGWLHQPTREKRLFWEIMTIIYGGPVKVRSGMGALTRKAGHWKGH